MKSNNFGKNPLDKSLDYVSHELIKDTLYITVVSNLITNKCPKCSVKSNKVHSRYQKSFQDLPIQGKKVIIIIKNRNFFCINKECDKYTFSEEFSFIDPKAKKTRRLIDEIVRVSLNQSSLSAARYLSETTAKVKKSSICNYLKKNNKNR